MPRKIRYKKQQKGHRSNKINSIRMINNFFNKSFVMIATSFGQLSEKQIETARMTINKNLKKFGKINVNIQADTPVSKKPLEIRMGKGKGAVDRWVAKIKYGTPLFTIISSSPLIAVKALRSAQVKLPLLTRILNYE